MSDWLSDTLANKYKSTYFYDRNNTGTPLEISGNIVLRGELISAVAMPIGSVMMWNGTYNEDGTIPNYENWQICDGSNNTPDLRGRFILGSTNSTSLDVTGEGQVSYSSGDTGGSEYITLSESELPSHTHSVGYGGSHSHGVVNYNANDFNWSNHYTVGNDDSWYEKYRYTQQGGYHRHDQYNQTGSSQAHENRPVYYVLAFIMRMY